MINLLPEQDKSEFRAARANVELLRFNFIFLIAAGVTLVLSLAAWGFLAAQRVAAEQKFEEQTQHALKYIKVEEAAAEYRNNIEIARTILKSSVDYTKVITDITNALPAGIQLEGINLNASQFGAPITIQARAYDYDAVKALKQEFQKAQPIAQYPDMINKSNNSLRMFSDVRIETISDASAPSSGSNPGQSESSYPLVVSISVKINKVVAQ